MECAPRVLTTKEGKELQLKEAKEFDIIIEKDTFHLKVAKIKDKNSIIIYATKINQLSDFFYESILSFDDFVKLDKIFRAYDELDEIFSIIVDCFQEKKIVIKEVKDDELQLGIKFMSLTGKEKIVDINLNKKEINQDSIIKELCKKINLLEEENKSLKNENKNIKEELKTMRNELDEVKKWQKNKEEEINKLIEIKRDEKNLVNIDSKIIKKTDELEFIEKIYKNNDNILMNKIFKPKLLYRATRDGDSSSSFHNKCDNIRGTLTLVKTKTGLKFGGYTEHIWNSSGYQRDDKAFCFSIDLKKKYNNKKTDRSIYCYKDYLSCFGDAIFWLRNSCFSKGGFMNDGLNKNYDNQIKGNEINNGNGEFGVVEVEVYEVILE